MCLFFLRLRGSADDEKVLYPRNRLKQEQKNPKIIPTCPLPSTGRARGEPLRGWRLGGEGTPLDCPPFHPQRTTAGARGHSGDWRFAGGKLTPSTEHHATPDCSAGPPPPPFSESHNSVQFTNAFLNYTAYVLPKLFFFSLSLPSLFLMHFEAFSSSFLAHPAGACDYLQHTYKLPMCTCIPCTPPADINIADCLF